MRYAEPAKSLAGVVPDSIPPFGKHIFPEIGKLFANVNIEIKTPECFCHSGQSFARSGIQAFGL
jgi:hypothetical protein